MDLMQLVTARRSVRDYDGRPVRREDINECLEAARLAPSACNSQPWHFVIVDEPALKGRVAAAMLSGVYGGMNGFVRQAPCLAAVVTDARAPFPAVCNVVRDTKMYLIDIGIACDHFILRAAERGIGTCLIGWFNEKAVRKALGIPRPKRVHIIIAMGYAAACAGEREKVRKPLSEMSSFNRFRREGPA